MGTKAIKFCADATNCRQVFSRMYKELYKINPNFKHTISPLCVSNYHQGNVLLWYYVIRPWLKNYFIKTNLIYEVLRCNYSSNKFLAMNSVESETDKLSIFLDVTFQLWDHNLFVVTDGSVIDYAINWHASCQGFEFWSAEDTKLKTRAYTTLGIDAPYLKIDQHLLYNIFYRSDKYGSHIYCNKELY